MVVVERVDPLLRGDETHELGRARLRFLDAVRRRNRRVTRREHRVDHDGVATLHQWGHLEVILHGDEPLAPMTAQVLDGKKIRVPTTGPRSKALSAPY